MMWRGATEWPAFGGGSSMIIAGGVDAKLVVHPIAPGSRPDTRLINWAICVRTGRADDPPPSRQEWSRPADRADLQRRAALFRVPHVDHEALVMATPETFEFPMCDRDPLPYWSLRNRAGGPERVIDEVERRAPAGFARLEDVIAPAALEAIVSSYECVTRQAAAPAR